MKPVARRCFLLLLPVLLLASCTSPARHPATGSFLGDKIVTTLDSPEAVYYLEHYLPGDRDNPTLDAKIDRLHHQAPIERLPDRAELAVIAGELSTDFAALYFANRVRRSAVNKALHTLFKRCLDDPPENDHALAASSNRYVVLFAPGWDYKANGHATGSDLAHPRELVSALGLESRLIAYGLHPDRPGERPFLR